MTAVNTTGLYIIISDSSRNKDFRFKRGLWKTEVLEFHELSTIRLLVEFTYAVNLLVIDIYKVDRK